MINKLVARRWLGITRQGCLTLPNSSNSGSFSTSCRKLNDKIYEYRTYNIQPKDVKQYVDTCNKFMHLRTKYSKALGYWICETGGINDMLHIWEYDSMNHRAEVRAALGGDAEWKEIFITKLMPWIIRQENCIMKCLPGTEVHDPPSAGGVYETQMFSYQGRSLDDISKTVQNIERPSATLLGSWYTAVGVQNTGYLLWHHADQDNLIRSPYNGSPKEGLNVVQSRLLLSAPWSAMK